MARPPDKSDPKRRAQRFGLRAEWMAAFWLSIKGYRLLERRFSVSGGD